MMTAEDIRRELEGGTNVTVFKPRDDAAPTVRGPRPLDAVTGLRRW